MSGRWASAGSQVSPLTPICTTLRNEQEITCSGGVVAASECKLTEKEYAAGGPRIRNAARLLGERSVGGWMRM